MKFCLCRMGGMIWSQYQCKHAGVFCLSPSSRVAQLLKEMNNYNKTTWSSVDSTAVLEIQ